MHSTVVAPEQWQEAHERLLAKEKAAMRAADELAAERRRMPMQRVEREYVFDAGNRQVSLLDLFEGRPQLAVYHFMFGPGNEEGCTGCSMFVDQLTHLAHLNARDVSFALVSRAPIARLHAFRDWMGWDVPWVSCGDSTFNQDMGVSGGFGFNVFLRDGDDVLRTYFTRGRGVEAIGSVWSILDRTPFGRQETWEDSPAGVPQSDPYVWWDLHDRYPA
jgi:predicted dithiol-disulfide oxidoreductase (DUF899 family)